MFALHAEMMFACRINVFCILGGTRRKPLARHRHGLAAEGPRARPDRAKAWPGGQRQRPAAGRPGGREQRPGGRRSYPAIKSRCRAWRVGWIGGHHAPQSRRGWTVVLVALGSASAHVAASRPGSGLAPAGSGSCRLLPLPWLWLCRCHQGRPGVPGRRNGGWGKGGSKGRHGPPTSACGLVG